MYAWNGKHPDKYMRRRHLVSANAADRVIASLSKTQGVERVVEPVNVEKTCTPSDTKYMEQRALPQIARDQAYDSITINSTATIAVLDPGVDAVHPDLSAVMVAGQSFTSGDADVDPNGHGTTLTPGR